MMYTLSKIYKEVKWKTAVYTIVEQNYVYKDITDCE